MYNHTTKAQFHGIYIEVYDTVTNKLIFSKSFSSGTLERSRNNTRFKKFTPQNLRSVTDFTYLLTAMRNICIRVKSL